MELAGSYADIRDFIHEIESSPEFVVIDHVAAVRGRPKRRLARPEPAAVDLLPDDRTVTTPPRRQLLLLAALVIVGTGDRCLAAAVDDRG